MPKVSIVIPLHNAAAYITETLESCFQQTHRDIEVIVVENASTDQSYDIVAKVKDVRLQLYRIDTPNAAAARNFGIQKATGDHILFLDADDILAHNKIELQLRALTEKTNGWIASCAWTKFDKEITASKVEDQPVWTIQDPLKWCTTSWMGGGMMIASCWLIPKHIIVKAGVWDEKLSLHDDGEFICRVLLVSQGQIFVNGTCVYYRQVDNSLSKQNKSLKAAQSALEVYKSYQNNILPIKDNKAIRLALAHNFSRFIYEFYPNHKSLLSEAKKHLRNLGVTHPPLVGGYNFKRLAKLIGFYNALKLRTWFKF